MDLSSRPEYQRAALVIYVVSTLVFLGVSAISPILPLLMDRLGLTNPEVGLLITVYTLPIVFVVPFVGWLADRIGRRPLMVAGLFVFGVSGTLIATTADFRTILALRFVQGVGFSAVSPLTITVLGDLLEGEAEAGAQGWRVFSVNLGGLVFPIVSGLLAGLAWNAPFLLFGLTIPAGLLVLFTLPEPDRPAVRDRGRLLDVLTVADDPVILGTLALGFTRFFAVFGILTFLPVLIASKDIGLVDVGVVIGLMSGMRMVVATQARRSFTIGAPPVTMVGGLIASSLLLSTFVLAETLGVFLLIAAVYGVFDGVVAPLQKSVLTQNCEKHVRAKVVSANAFFKFLGQTAGPVGLGVVVSVLGPAQAIAALGIGGTAVGVGLLLVFVAGSADVSMATAS